jgi:hypothetical protein
LKLEQSRLNNDRSFVVGHLNKGLGQSSPNSMQRATNLVEEAVMEKSDFDNFLAALGKASDTAQSVFYVLIIVYIAMLLYGLYAFVYPVRQFVYVDTDLKIRCLYDPGDPKCVQVKGSVERAKQPPRLDQETEHVFREHELQLFYDNSVAARNFTFPIFGWETDRVFFWLFFPLVGVIGYYIVWLALSRQGAMFRFLLNCNRNDALRLRLILSTLMITAPLSGEHAEITPFYQAIWRALAILVFLIPIINSLLAISDTTNAIPVIRDGSPFLDGWTTLQSLPRLAFEVLVLALQVALFRKLVTLARRFVRDQNEAEHLIAMLEARSETA